MTGPPSDQWIIHVGMRPPKDPVLAPNGLPLGTNDLEQSADYWWARIKAIEEHPTMPAEVKAQEIRLCEPHLQALAAELRKRGLR